MKVLSVAGYHHTGKTTVVVELLKELKRREYSVASIKDIHSEKFTMEKEGSNSWKHWEASQNDVIARGLAETYQIWHQRLELPEMLSRLNADWVIVEGMKTAALPRILCAGNEEELEELLDDTVFAVSGLYSDKNKNFRDLPVFRAESEIAMLTDLVEQKVFDFLPLAKPECCSACGMSCYQMVGAILKGERTRQDCVLETKKEIKVKSDGQEVVMVPYVQNTLKDIIIAYLKNLKGLKLDKEIEIKINQSIRDEKRKKS